MLPNVKSFRDSVATPYIDALVTTIENRFAEEGVKLHLFSTLLNYLTKLDMETRK